MDQPTFNLVDEPWIPLTMRDGSHTAVSLRDVFARAHEAKAFSEPSPLTYVSIARFLLAVAHRALDGPTSPAAWVTVWQAGRFDPEPFDAYFDTWRHRFDLFDAEQPFCQAPRSAFSQDEKVKPLSKLALERASGTNATLFDHSADDRATPTPPDQGARMLLTAMNYGFGEGGIYRDTTLVRLISFLVEGRSVFETIVLNLQRYPTPTDLATDGAGGDAPWWETGAPVTETKEETPPRGLTDHLTRRGRKVHLINRDGRITGMLYRPGMYFDSSTEGSDPFFAWSKKPKDGSLSPMRFTIDRALWRDAEVLFQARRAEESESGAAAVRPAFLDHLSQVATVIEDRHEMGEDIPPLPPLRLMAFGVTPRPSQAVALQWRVEQMPLPVDLLKNRLLVTSVIRALGVAEDAAAALQGAGRRLAKSLLREGDSEPRRNEVTAQVTQLQLDERFWPRLELAFHVLLHNVAADRDAALRDWMLAVLQLAQQAYEDAARIVGADARSIKAQMVGLHMLHCNLAPLRVQLEELTAYVQGGIAS